MVFNNKSNSGDDGLSKDNPDAHNNTIDYALNTQNNGKLLVYENSANKGTFQNYIPGDTLRVRTPGKY